MKRNALKALQLSANQSLPAQTLRAMRRFESDKKTNTAMALLWRCYGYDTARYFHFLR